MSLWNYRALNAIAAFACFSLVGYAIYAQMQLHLEPCPLCILQRVGFLIAGAFFLLAALHNPVSRGRKIYAAGALTGTIFGLSVAGRHVQLRHMPADQVPACGPGLEHMLDNFPLSKTIKQIFTGSGECAAGDGWLFLGLDMPSWCLIWFAGLTLFALYSGFFRRAFQR
jgi:protein dithiol:quinone oxidoreductase